MIDLIGALISLLAVIGLGFSGYTNGKRAFFEERVEKLRQRQKRRLLRRKL